MTSNVKVKACTFSEFVMANECRYGCKVYKCDECGAAKVIHSKVYGCTMPVAK